MNAASHNTNAITHGTVIGAPRRWLRLEATALLTAAAIAYTTTHQPWWLIPLTLLLPDLDGGPARQTDRRGEHGRPGDHRQPGVERLGWPEGRAVAGARPR